MFNACPFLTNIQKKKKKMEISQKSNTWRENRFEAKSK